MWQRAGVRKKRKLEAYAARFIHAADFHLDSAFAALTPRQAAARRRESRELPVRLASYVNQNNIDLGTAGGGPL